MPEEKNDEQLAEENAAHDGPTPADEGTPDDAATPEDQQVTPRADARFSGLDASLAPPLGDEALALDEEAERDIDPDASASERHVQVLRKREIGRHKAAQPVKAQIDQQLREAGLA